MFLTGYWYFEDLVLTLFDDILGKSVSFTKKKIKFFKTIILS